MFNLFMNQYSIQSLLIRISNTGLRLFFTVVFLIAMFAYIHDNLKQLYAGNFNLNHLSFKKTAWYSFSEK